MLIDPDRLNSMPDVAESQVSPFDSQLDWVGMENIELPLTVSGGLVVPAKGSIFVDISDPGAKGIHMSRLYLELSQAIEKSELSLELFKSILSQSIESQRGLSKNAWLQLKWDHLIQRKALLSENQGWKSYPVFIDSKIIDGQWTTAVKISILYSSTCPCSAALSRQLRREAFEKKFTNENMNHQEIANWLADEQVAAPHSQRSQSDITMTFKASHKDLDLVRYIDCVEKALATPVQTAVKREDEQEFARLNGENLMFVEDALRRIKKVMLGFSEVESFNVKASHFESLHSHDAVGFVSKN